MEKVALITGGSRGIGLGIARKLAEEGYHLAINGVRPAKSVTGILEELRGFKISVIYCPGDIGIEADRKNILDKTRQEFGGVNVLINNAGVAPKVRRDLLEMTEESFDWVMGINLKGSFFLTQAVAREMLKKKEENRHFPAMIINISSISATIASINRGEYCISKAGLGMLTQLFAARLGAYAIPVYEIRPGIIETDMTAAVKEKYDRLIAEGLTIQPRWGMPEDVGKAVAALVRGDFPYSTGQVLMIDGGLSIPRL